MYHPIMNNEAYVLTLAYASNITEFNATKHGISPFKT